MDTAVTVTKQMAEGESGQFRLPVRLHHGGAPNGERAIINTVRGGGQVVRVCPSKRSPNPAGRSATVRESGPARQSRLAASVSSVGIV